MSSETKSIQDLYHGLIVLSADLFPKRCMTCGRVYETAEQYIEETAPVSRGSGLQSSEEFRAGTPVVHLFRNCACGSTLLSFFSDRRDSSEQGRKYRAMFEQLLRRIEKEGVERKTARAGLIKTLAGGKSKALEKFGIKG